MLARPSGEVRKKAMRILLAGLVALVSSHSIAGELPQEARDAIQKIGPVINVPETTKILAPLQQKEPYAGVAVSRDEKYGSDDHHRLDVFRSNDAASLPVLLFVHGGGYVRGDKRAAGSPFYDNVMLWAVEHKMVGVNMNYRLAPASPWPAAVEDIAAAFAWTYANIARFGGDPAQIVLMGHSSGATHVSSYLAHPGIAGRSPPHAAGAILVSGNYDLKPEIDLPGERSYFGSDTALWADRSSIAGLTKTNVPLLIAHGELDVPYYIEQAEALKARLCSERKCPTFVSISGGNNHMSEIYGLNTMDTSLSEPMRSFIGAVTSRRAAR
jgi:acetyl esterase/lipase